MDAVSWIVIAVIVITLVMLLHRRFSPTMILLSSNIIIFAIMFVAFQNSYNFTLEELGFKPAMSYRGEEPWTLITSLFIHADISHLMFNMLFLMLIGFPLESMIGKRRFVAVFLVGGLIGTAAFEVAASDPLLLLVGCSGSISALLGAMIVLCPREKVSFFVGPFITNRFTIWVPAVLWIVMQSVLLAFDDSPVAYVAHIGGFAGGIATAWLVRPKYYYEYGGHKMYDIEPLKKLCVTKELKEAYECAEKAKDIRTKMMWIEVILNEIKNPSQDSYVEIDRRRYG
ncbi:MAG: rhomboid family intramembrane serine protease [Methanomassiliicoccaceae archaeon]|nr:rhomboid family intramembrane serine protease [Methanomassiliicoccaceae archaeon]